MFQKTQSPEKQNKSLSFCEEGDEAIAMAMYENLMSLKRQRFEDFESISPEKPS
jgi:hypothetical protein